MASSFVSKLLAPQTPDVLEDEQASQARVRARQTFEDNNASAYSGRPRPAYREMVKLIESEGIEGISEFAWQVPHFQNAESVG